MKKYTLLELIKIYSEFEPTDWEAISTESFLTHLFDLQEKENDDQNNSPFDNSTDSLGDYQ